MKIGIDISQIIYEGTGVGSYTKNLVENLLKLEGQDEIVLFGSSLRQYYKLNNFYQKVRNLGNIDYSFFHIPEKVLNILWNDIHIIGVDNLLGSVDVFHSSDWIQPPSKAKKITTIHDLVVYKYPDLSDPYIVSTQKKRLKLVKKECDLIIAVSESTKKDIVEILGIPEEKIRVVYPGIDDKFHTRNDKEIMKMKKKYNILGDYILSVGTIEPRKNLDRLIEAFKLFSNHSLIKTLDEPIELVLVGKTGWGSLLPLPQHVRKLGLVEDELLPVLYSGAAMFLYPSLYEGVGYPILEAMASGTPVITSDRGSPKEVAGEAGLYVDPLDIKEISIKMTNLFIDNKRREKMIEMGLAQARQFNWLKTARQTLSLYRELYSDEDNK